MPRLLLFLHRPILLPQDAPVQDILGLPEGEVLEGEEDAPGHHQTWFQVFKVQGGVQEELELPTEVANILQCGQEKRCVCF